MSIMCSKEEINSITEEVLDYFFSREEFSPFVEHPTSSNWWKIRNDFYTFPDLEDYGVDFIEAGCTKGVIGLPNFVIKIPFVEAENYGDDNYRECCDCCKVETRHYKAAKKVGLEHYFAEEYFYGEVNGLFIYIQERAISGGSELEDRACRYVEATSECSSYYESFEDTEEFYTLFTEEESYKYDGAQLIDFLYENCIDDIHCGNLGYRYDTHELIFIDYSGYGSAESLSQKHKDDESFWNVE